MKSDTRCWDCGREAPGGVCLGPHAEGAYMRGRGKKMVFSANGNPLCRKNARPATVVRRRAG